MSTSIERDLMKQLTIDTTAGASELAKNLMALCTLIPKEAILTAINCTFYETSSTECQSTTFETLKMTPYKLTDIVTRTNSDNIVTRTNSDQQQPRKGSNRTVWFGGTRFGSRAPSSSESRGASQ